MQEEIVDETDVYVDVHRRYFLLYLSLFSRLLTEGDLFSLIVTYAMLTIYSWFVDKM